MVVTIKSDKGIYFIMKVRYIRVNTFIERNEISEYKFDVIDFDCKLLKWNDIDINNCNLAEFNCLWQKASKDRRNGGWMTGLGAAGGVSGWLLVVIGSFGYEDVMVAAGAVILVTGLVCIVTGPIKIIRGSVRKSELKKTPHYNPIKTGSLNISPSIGINQFNNTYNYGVTLSFTF